MQQIFDELSNVLRLDADSLISKAPIIRRNQGTIRTMFNTISKGGLNMKNLMSIMPLVTKIK